MHGGTVDPASCLRATTSIGHDEIVLEVLHPASNLEEGLAGRDLRLQLDPKPVRSAERTISFFGSNSRHFSEQHSEQREDWLNSSATFLQSPSRKPTKAGSR